MLSILDLIELILSLKNFEKVSGRLSIDTLFGRFLTFDAPKSLLLRSMLENCFELSLEEEKKNDF